MKNIPLTIISLTTPRRNWQGNDCQRNGGPELGAIRERVLRSLVAADVRRLLLFLKMELEPSHVGCYFH